MEKFLQQQDVDLNGHALLHHTFNVRAVGQLKGDGVQNVTPLLPALEQRALAGGTDEEIEFPKGRYLFSTNFSSSTGVTYRARRGAVFVIPAGVTVTLDHVEAGPYKCFEVDPSATLIIRKSSVMYPQWFGAVADGSHDDTVPIQTAFNVLALTTVQTGAYGLGAGRLKFPSGRYRVTNTIRLTRGVGVHISGDAIWGSQIIWDGTADIPVWQYYNARSVETSNLYFAGKPSAPPSYVIEVQGDTTDASRYFVPGRCVFKRLIIGGGGAAMANVGIAYTYAPGSQGNNNDQGYLENVEISNTIEANFQFGTSTLSSPNAKSFQFENCVFTDGKYGVKDFHGDYTWTGGYVGQHTESNFWFGASPNEPIRIDRADSEGSARFLVVAAPSWLGHTSAFFVSNCRVSATALAADRYMIWTTHPGPMFFTGNKFGEPTPIPIQMPIMRHDFQTGAVGTQGGYVEYVANAFDALDLSSDTGLGSYDVPVIQTNADNVNAHGVIVLRGNTYRKRGAAPDYAWEVRVKAEERCTGVQGISGNALVQANNLRGSFNVTGAATTATVTFSTAEPDGNYYLSITPTAFGGGAAAGSNRVLSITKTAASFTVTLEAAPGGAVTNSFDWHLIR